MFPILRTLVIMLHGLGVHNYLYRLDEERPLIVDEMLFLNAANTNRIMFTNIAYFLFSILDDQGADQCFNKLMPIENNVQYNMFVKQTIAWLRELSNTFEPLRYVPITDEVFYDCSGPLMHQVMFAFTMAVVKYKMYIGEGKIMVFIVAVYQIFNVDLLRRCCFDEQYRHI